MKVLRTPLAPLLAALISMAPVQVSAAPTACESVPFWFNLEGKRGNVANPGAWCLHTDLYQKRVFDLHAGSYRSLGGMQLLEIRCDWQQFCKPEGAAYAYDIDLRGHKLESEAPELVGIGNRRGGAFVTVRNGTVVVPGEKVSNVGIKLRGFGQEMIMKDGGRCWPWVPDCADRPASEARDGKGPVYEPSRYRIEGMTVRAGGRGIETGGGGNVIRDSVIEVDGRVGVFQYGPDALIENNTIIVHGGGDVRPADAALKLRDAHGSIVRNNRFIFKGAFWRTPPAAIGLLDSRDVQLDNNTFEGFRETVRTAGDSSYQPQQQ